MGKRRRTRLDRTGLHETPPKRRKNSEDEGTLEKRLDRLEKMMENFVSASPSTRQSNYSYETRNEAEHRGGSITGSDVINITDNEVTSAGRFSLLLPPRALPSTSSASEQERTIPEDILQNMDEHSAERAPGAAPAYSVERAPGVAPACSVEHAPGVAPAYSVERAPGVAPTYNVERAPCVAPAYSVERAPSVAPAYSEERTPSVAPAYSVERAPIVAPVYNAERTPGVAPEGSEQRTPVVAPIHSVERAPGVAPEWSEQHTPVVAPTHSVERACGTVPPDGPERCRDYNDSGMVCSSRQAAVETIHAPTGGQVELPCDVAPALDGDRMGLVIWYKQGHTSPIYTVDTREGVTSHWSDPATLGARASFRGDSNPAVLILTRLKPEDTGQYRCRVDFVKSPTKNSRLNLTVLIPPERLILLNHEGNEVTSGVLGPYDEGTEVNITCVAVGGRPTARVSWWKSHALLANSEARATVSFKLQRSDLGNDVTCQAVTDPSITPVSETLSIDVNLRPLWVRVQGGKRPLVAGQSTELVCQAVGARPKPSLSWWKGGTRLKSTRETISVDGNVTNSILTFVPEIQDAGRVLSCRAVQPSLSHSTQEDGWKMEIQHFPVATLELGANLDASKVVEGSDVYLDCRVRANPWHHHVYFTHNGVLVKPGPGVLLANQSLVLQRVSRAAAGAYVCSARNALGEGSSERLVLDVKYVPTCKSPQPVVMRAARGEVVEIECSLDANPYESVSFHWWFNSSAHTKHELSTATVNAAQNMPGTFLYMVNTSADYGWVQCSGSNSVGRQTKPCLFHILPADKPSSVKACEITNVTYDSLTLNCTPGHDGGIRQYFSLQVFDMSTGHLLANLSNEEPEFEVFGLSGSSALSVSVRAVNRKGASEPLTLTSSLLKIPQRHTAQVPVKVELTTVLLIVLGVVGVIAATTAVSAAVFCCRHCNKRKCKSEKEKRQQDESSNIPLTGNKESESVDSLDKNPDIIPLDGKISDSCSNKSSTTDYSSIRPLISKSSGEKYDSVPPNCNDRYSYDHNIEQCNQYVQVRPIEYRGLPTYQTNLPMPNLGPSIQSLGPMVAHLPGDYHMQRPRDKVYEDWLKYKNALPLNTSGLLPPEQLMPPELYSSPSPHPLYSNPNRNPLNLAQMPELEHRYHLDPRSLGHNGHMGPENRSLGHNMVHMVPESRSCSNSPPVRFAENSSVYFNKSALDRTSTLPHFKQRVNGSSSPMQQLGETKSGIIKTELSNPEPTSSKSPECG